ncbi:mitotic checkpoint serine/threonine protein kinase [Teratosphaeria destructans]|uniref:Mitotic checkpoint serine/threonine protein kinase n=1 Tax=Teratosphaeria destructans TaxID=418781 RepID=A0A9W7W892_9PEZI|nr:mitotic checkpoint serine/threonine protein kinase [Teratosphaeria destructans]
MASDDLIDFDVIEGHKENIQALPAGRSAKALAQLYSPPLGPYPSPALAQDAHSEARKPFEEELQTIDEADDPLDVYDRYVKWTLDAYPSAQATPQSQLLPLLERATKTFQSSAHYKNDPRYLKIWLHYIRLFADARARCRWNQAEEIYRLGIEKEAAPAARLLRKFGEFEQRRAATPHDAAEPSSPALSIARPALAAKIDPFAAATASPSTGHQHARSTASRKSKSSKMAIFSDSDDASPRPASGSSSRGWDNIGSLAERKKENTVQAKPWTGEKMAGGKTNGGMQKLMVFKDESTKRSLPSHIQRSLLGDNSEQECTRNPKSGRLECVFVNLEAVYPEVGPAAKEYCFEELRARHRGWLDKEWRRPQQTNTALMPEMKLQIHTDPKPEAPDPRDDSFDLLSGPAQQAKPKQGRFKIFEDAPQEPETSPRPSIEDRVLVESFSKTMALNDENDENAPPKPTDKEIARQLRREERQNRTRKIQVMDVKHIKNETKTIQLNLDSPTGPAKLKRKKSAIQAEPTMTINTKEAMDEIYGIFSQPLPSQAEQTDGEEEDSDDDYTTGDESTNTGKLSGTASEYGDETRREMMAAAQAGEHENQTEGDVSGWSDFTRSKHVPDVEGALESAPSTGWDVYQDGEGPTEEEDVITPQDENPRTMYVPVPPEDYEPPTNRFRDMSMLPQHRLPFMTPIVEQTESSFGAATAHTEKDFFAAKTPSRKTNGSHSQMPETDELASSPFQEVTTDLAEEKRKVLQPIRTKSTKGTIALGAGTAKSQIAAKTKSNAAPEPVQKGPIIKEERCNPMDPYLRQTILSQIKPPLTSYDGYHEHLDTTVNLDKTASTLSLPPMLSFQGAEGAYIIKRELGAGTFAPVYLVENSAAADDGTTDGKHPHSRSVGKAVHRKPLEAIKMEDPPSTWEFYIIQQSHRRLGVSRAAESIVRAHEMHLFRDECFLVEEYRDQGTLLDLVNIARVENPNGGGMDEMLAMWLTVELLRTTEALHSKGIIHGDLKGDNVLVRFDDPGDEVDWSPTYFPSGAHGWASKGIALIDFGRGIDMRQFPPHVAFLADWPTGAADCAEMRELRPWTYQIDYHGLAGIIHSLLFGKYMDPVAEPCPAALGAGPTKTYRVRESFKRYWQVAMWQDVFALLLNPLAHVAGVEEGARMPCLRGMRRCRERMEAWLEEGCERGVGLKGMVVRMEGLIRERRRKGGR